MNIQKYINKKKELQSYLLTFLENSENVVNDFDNLINIIQLQNIEGNEKELICFLRLLSNISNNFHRNATFNKKIEDIILYFEKSIKNTMLDSDIFHIFNENKQILLFLIEKKFITAKFILQSQYYHFFYPEIKEFLNSATKESIENDLLNQNSESLNTFNERRKLGENDSHICRIIRNDDIDNFIIFTTQSFFKLSSKIPNSFFETNPLLVDKDPTFIEYAAFYGSIQIFQYLKANKVELKPSIWIYAIHSKSADLIHIIEDSKIELPENFVVSCLLESIKCHHNDIANYIKNNHVDIKLKDNKRPKLIKSVFECSLHYSNYFYFPLDFNSNNIFFNLCLYDYSTIVDLFIETKRKEFMSNSILKSIILLIKF